MYLDYFNNQPEYIFKLMPGTRYQGSKRKLLPFIYEHIKDIKFKTVLDPFGGTGSVTSLFALLNKRVTYIDILNCNAIIAKALFHSDSKNFISEAELESLFARNNKVKYKSHIEDNYRDIFFTGSENVEIDTFCQNIERLSDEISKYVAYYLLFQAALSKRPYNLFHRANLDIRMRDVKRSFGNKTTWDKPFIGHMKKFRLELLNYREAAESKVNCETVIVKAGDIFSHADSQSDTQFDLVYLDTPYHRKPGSPGTDYFNFYNFLDALLKYEDIPQLINWKYANRPIYNPMKPWFPQDNIHEAFKDIFERYKKSVIVLSYRSDGVPSPDEFKELLSATHSDVNLYEFDNYKYALSKNSESKEILIIGKPA
ncbi:MAG: DNA adenine methylase [Deltaproteobacteria bacterium]|nr:DNA adenine methylase [Deltaproteobacteria bacterium]